LNMMTGRPPWKLLKPASPWALFEHIRGTVQTPLDIEHETTLASFSPALTDVLRRCFRRSVLARAYASDLLQSDWFTAEYVSPVEASLGTEKSESSCTSAESPTGQMQCARAPKSVSMPTASLNHGPQSLASSSLSLGEALEQRNALGPTDEPAWNHGPLQEQGRAQVHAPTEPQGTSRSVRRGSFSLSSTSTSAICGSDTSSSPIGSDRIATGQLWTTTSFAHTVHRRRRSDPCIRAQSGFTAASRSFFAHDTTGAQAGVPHRGSLSTRHSDFASLQRKNPFAAHRAKGSDPHHEEQSSVKFTLAAENDLGCAPSLGPSSAADHTSVAARASTSMSAAVSLGMSRTTTTAATAAEDRHSMDTESLSLSDAELLAPDHLARGRSASDPAKTSGGSTQETLVHSHGKPVSARTSPRPPEQARSIHRRGLGSSPPTPSSPSYMLGSLTTTSSTATAGHLVSPASHAGHQSGGAHSHHHHHHHHSRSHQGASVTGRGVNWRELSAEEDLNERFRQRLSRGLDSPSRPLHLQTHLHGPHRLSDPSGDHSATHIAKAHDRGRRSQPSATVNSSTENGHEYAGAVLTPRGRAGKPSGIGQLLRRERKSRVM